MNLIDRDALVRYLNDIALSISGQLSKLETYDTLQGVMEIIEEQPTVDAAPVVHGEWVNVVGGFFEMGRCSVCGGQWPTAGGLNFCPNCGAKMRHEDGEVGID